MSAELHAFLAGDHERLDAVLDSCLRTGDPESYDGFRRGLLRHIAIEERVLFPLLRTRQGNDFDLASMDVQAALHAHGALLGDLLLAPQVQNPELAQELRGLRRTVQDHLRAAADLQGRLLPAP